MNGEFKSPLRHHDSRIVGSTPTTPASKRAVTASSSYIICLISRVSLVQVQPCHLSQWWVAQLVERRTNKTALFLSYSLKNHNLSLFEKSENL